MAKKEALIRGKEVRSAPQKGNGIWGAIWLPAALILALSAGGLTGVLASYYFNNSRFSIEVSALATYRPPEVTKIYADDGETVLAEFAQERRIPIKENEIPKLVEDALIAVEDIRFYDHIGVDPIRLAGAVVKNITTGSKEGASTLTQQLAKNLFLSREQTFTRKFNEWMVSLQIERFYTKRQILEMYMNYVFMGAGAYGFEAASQTYFNKSLKELNLEEAALLAAIPKSGTEYAPTRNPDKAKTRRDVVLDQMAKYGMIPESEAAAAKSKPIKLADTAYYQNQPKSTPWDYPVEEVRKYLEEKYTTRVAQGGLKVYTTINIEGQKLATKTIRERLRAYDRGRAWRSEYQDILMDENNQPLTDEKQIRLKLGSFKHPDWFGDEYEAGEFIKGLVVSIDAAKNEAEVRFGKFKAIVSSKDMGRSGKQPKDELRPGLICEFEIKSVDEENKVLSVSLSQVPNVQAAILTIHSKTGEIPVMVGGYDFATNRFNNATQGLRQTGSCYKPYVYAAAIEWGITPEMLVSGAPIRRGGWMPHNYDGSLSHPNVPMKTALAKSYNLAAVHLLEQVGVQTGAQMVRRLGITQPMAPSLPSALGASEAPLEEMVSAYSVFPNKGIRMEPHLIRKVLDRDGKILEEWENKSYKSTSEYVASTMVEMMQGVVRGGGTASGASAGGHPLAGKTGTVNDHTDVWFIGFTPAYTTGVWMGNPERKESLGKGMTGGHGAVPYFNSFMIPFMKDKERTSFSKPPPMPEEIKEMNEARKREELEKLEKAESEGRSLGVSFNPGPKVRTGIFKKDGSSSGDITIDSNGGVRTKIEDTGTDTISTPSSSPRGGNDSEPPVVVKPPEKKADPPAKKADPPPTPAGRRRKAKKGKMNPDLFDTSKSAALLLSFAAFFSIGGEIS